MMTLPETLLSIANRFEQIVAASGDAAIALLKYPELLEKEPALKEFVKRATPFSHREGEGLNMGHKPRQRKTKKQAE
jgi:phosphoenolpyruvate carboxylase